MIERSRGHVLIAGITARAFAISAARAGYRVTAVDAFGDRDLREVAEVIVARGRAGEQYGPLQAAAVAASVPAECAAYTSNFENYPAAVTCLAQGRRLLGNPAETLTRVRNPIEVMRVLRRNGLASPVSLSRAPGSGSLPDSWLLKPRRSGGGHGIRPWRPGQPIPRTMYLQQRIAGIPGSISFAANGADAVVLGFSRQLIGRPELGADRFRYCGSILATPDAPLFPRQAELLERAVELATVLAREFHLVGVNGIDFISRRGIPYPIEVNPRHSGSMELIERGTGLSMFDSHVQSCHGDLPRMVQRPAEVHGKAIVFARRDVTVGDFGDLMAREWVADVPHAGERILRGRPICTVFARSADAETCHRILTRRARAIHRAVRPAPRQAA